MVQTVRTEFKAPARKRRVTFNRTELISAAWEFLWADNLKARKSIEAYGWPDTFYLTASDIEAQVRRFISEALNGEPRGSTGRAYGKGYDGVRVSGDLLGDVRRWLLSHRGLVSHNFGRGHISGMRFRPVGAPLSPAEEKTLAYKERSKGRPKPRHYSKGGMNGHPLCTQSRRGRWGRPSYSIWKTRDKAGVTCPRCLKLISQPEFKSEEASPDDI
jgi:hypothetical protein